MPMHKCFYVDILAMKLGKTINVWRKPSETRRQNNTYQISALL